MACVIYNRNVFLTVLEAGSWRSENQPSLVLKMTSFILQTADIFLSVITLQKRLDKFNGFFFF
jgi:hypothetical protein